MENLVGTKNEITKTVTKELLASSVGSGMVNVFATPMMIAGMEETAAESLRPYLAEGKTTVGIEISVSHTAATPLGMKVTFKTEVTGVSENGKIITFKVSAFDEKELIGEGTHKRAVIDLSRFELKANAKLS